jgi:hypothetical protein
MQLLPRNTPPVAAKNDAGAPEYAALLHTGL